VIFFFKPFFVEESLGNTREKERKGEGMSKMMDRWLQKAKEEGHKEAKSKARDQAVKDYIAKHDTLDGFDMDKDYTKDYPQEDVLRVEETVQTVEATFHTGYVWTVWVDLVCD
jgi:hypothetical protein